MSDAYDDFKAWFATGWKQRHEAVEIPRMPHASWDRKAAYLLWVAEGRPTWTEAASAVSAPAPVEEDIFN